MYNDFKRSTTINFMLSMTLQLYVRYTLTDLCTLLSDNGRLLGVQLLLPASS